MKKKLWIIVDGDTGDYGYELNFGAPSVFTNREEAIKRLEENWNNLIQYDNNWKDNDQNELNKEEGCFTYTNGCSLVCESVYEVEIDL